jgi:cytochrome P450
MTTSAGTIPLFSQEYYQNPYPVFARLREESPVHEFRFHVGDVRMWMVTRYDDVRDVLGDPRFSSEGRTWGSPEFKAAGLVPGAGSVLERSLTVVDAPAHTRLRKLASQAFMPRRIAQWRAATRRVVAATLDECERRGAFDVMDDYASAIGPVLLGEILGVRIEQHREMVAALEQAFPSDPALMDQVPEGFARICRYAEELVAEKRAAPGEDLASAFIQARDAEDRLTEEELVAMVAIIVLAGSDTIRAFLGNAVLALLDHPDQRRLLLERPDLHAPAVEEFLRYEGPLSTALFRVTTEDLELAGTVLPAGAPVLAGLLSANRDPRRFPDPDRLDLTRGGVRHLGFGHGLHHCLGAALARLVGEIAIPAPFARFPSLRLGMPREEIRYIENWTNRRIERLPVEVSPAGGRERRAS